MIKEVIGGPMMWDGYLDVTIDNFTLLRAIRLIGGDSGTVMAGLWENPNFAILKDNDHLRNLLEAYLSADNDYSEQWRRVKNIGKIWAFFHPQTMNVLESNLRDLQDVRDQAFKAYEMFRKLTDYENPLLKRIPFSGESLHN